MQTLHLEQQGETITFLTEANVRRCAFEVRLAPGADGPPPHFHLGQDESFEVVSGVFHATLDGTEHRLGAGERVTIRSGVVHTFRNGLANEPLVLRGAMEPPLRFHWALSEMARSAIRGGGSWKHLSLLDAGWVLHQVRGEYYTAGIPRPLHHLLTGFLATLARLVGQHRRIAPPPLLPVRTGDLGRRPYTEEHSSWSAGARADDPDAPSTDRAGAIREGYGWTGREVPMTKDPRRDRVPSSEEPVTRADLAVDPMGGAHGKVRDGTPLGPRPVERVEHAPGTGVDVVDPRQERLEPNLDTPDLRPAVLGRLEGMGLLIRVRSADGSVASVDGTWRPSDESTSSDELGKAYPEGSVTRFAGTLIETRDEDAAEEAELEVVIRGQGEYEDADGRSLHIVTFEPRV